MEHKPGSFCWVELATTDQAAAKEFYQDLFGWTTTDGPLGDGKFYTMWYAGGKKVGGGYQITPEMKGCPPNWMPYISVTDADATASRAKDLGGAVGMEPFDVMEMGRMTVIKDPAGAHISIWQPKTHAGSDASNQPGMLCWTELNTPEPDKTAKFYEELFGWKYPPGKDHYRHIENQGEMIGGINGEFKAPPGTPAHWMIYFMTADCKKTAEQAAKLGAKTLFAAQLVDDVGTIAVLADPQGAVFALYQELERAA